MNETYILAFVITPMIVVALAWGGVFLHSWALRKERRREAERRS